MNKLYLTILMGLMLVGTILATTSLVSITLDRESKDILYKVSYIEDIIPSEDTITCDRNFCKSHIYQAGLIDTDWIIPNDGRRISEMEIERDEWVTNRLNQFAQVEAIRHPERNELTIEAVAEEIRVIRLVNEEPIEETPVEEIILP